MSQQELLRRVTWTLDGSGIQYMVTGSTASSLQGEPRSTHDIDLVVAIEITDAKKLFNAFPSPDFYLDEGCMIDAINRLGAKLDMDYLHRWAKELDVESMLQKLQEEAEEL